MSIAKLPTELQELICSLVDDRRDLIRLSQASKQLNRLTQRNLYRAIRITSILQAGRFIRSAKRKGRASHVREFTLDVYDTNFTVYGWAMKQLPDSNSDREAYLQGLGFNTEILSMFPRLETLRVYAQYWSSQLVRKEWRKVLGQNTLNTLRSCTLAFRPPEDQQRGLHWNLSPWNELLRLRELETLELVRAEGDAALLINGTNEGLYQQKTSLKSLRLLCCELSHNWLDTYLRCPTSLKELEVVVTTEKAASFAEHMFLQRCSCMKPLMETLETLSYVNLRTIPRHHSTHHFAMFTRLKELTVSATELFGDVSRGNIEASLQSLSLSMPPTLQILRLYIHRLDLYGDAEGHVEGVFKVLHDLLKPENKYRVPALCEIILHVYAKDPEVPSPLLFRGAASGVKVRLVTMDEIVTLRERHQLRLLMS